MPTRRRSTVYDFAALQLHPDGTRVQNTEKNLGLRKAKYSVRDSKGNWIARDAGGTGTVKQRWAEKSEIQTSDVQDGEQVDLTGTNDKEDESSSRRKGKERAEDGPEDELKDARAKKRRRFQEDWSFLESSNSRAPSIDQNPSLEGPSSLAGSGASDLPKPSSDLLKCIHYFASTYYSAMGQLYDASKEARREKKRRHLNRLSQRTTSVDVGSSRQAQSSEAGVEHGNYHSPTEDEEGVEDEEGDDVDEGHEKYKRKIRSRSHRGNYVDVDMYKMFDGSALMAIGMFVQEHISQLLTSDIPEGWEDVMAVAEQTADGNGKADRRRKRHRKRRRGKRGIFGTDEDDAEDEDTQDTAESDIEEHAYDEIVESTKRETRGVILPPISAPYDDNSDDEDFVP